MSKEAGLLVGGHLDTQKNLSLPGWDLGSGWAPLPRKQKARVCSTPPPELVQPHTVGEETVEANDCWWPKQESQGTSVAAHNKGFSCAQATVHCRSGPFDGTSSLVTHEAELLAFFFFCLFFNFYYFIIIIKATLIFKPCYLGVLCSGCAVRGKSMGPHVHSSLPLDVIHLCLCCNGRDLVTWSPHPSCQDHWEM